MDYNENNIFYKILIGEISCQKVYEDSNVLAFYDIHPKALQHIIVIPKGRYVSFDDFAAHGTDHEINAFFRTVQKIANDLGISTDGYRLISNHGKNANQEVPHFHVHLLGGEPLGRKLVKE